MLTIASRMVHKIWALRPNPLSTHVFLVFVLWFIPTHTPLKYRCLFKINHQIMHIHLMIQSCSLLDKKERACHNKNKNPQEALSSGILISHLKIGTNKQTCKTPMAKHNTRWSNTITRRVYRIGTHVQKHPQTSSHTRQQKTWQRAWYTGHSPRAGKVEYGPQHCTRQ